MLNGMVAEPGRRGGNIPIQEFSKSRWGVKPRYLAGPTILFPQILEPEDLAVRGIDKREMETMEIELTTPESPRVSLGLTEHVLWTQAQFLGFNSRKPFSPMEQDVIGRPLGSLILFDGCRGIGGPGEVPHDGGPAGRC